MRVKPMVTPTRFVYWANAQSLHWNSPVRKQKERKVTTNQKWSISQHQIPKKKVVTKQNEILKSKMLKIEFCNSVVNKN